MIPNTVSLSLSDLPARASNVDNTIKQLWGGARIECISRAYGKPGGVTCG